LHVPPTPEHITLHRAAMMNSHPTGLLVALLLLDRTRQALSALFQGLRAHVFRLAGDSRSGR
jgi:hypothetical protein